MQISALAAPARTAAGMADINFFITVFPLSFSLQYIIHHQNDGRLEFTRFLGTAIRTLNRSVPFQGMP
jgi:hypothetical protein